MKKTFNLTGVIYSWNQPCLNFEVSKLPDFETKHFFNRKLNLKRF